MSIQINNINAIDDDRNFSAAGIVTVGTGNSATIIDGTTGITSVGIGITMEGVPGNISIAGTITAGGFNIPANIVSFSPANGATNVAVTTSIVLTFDQVIGVGTTGFVYLREGSAGGTTLQTFGVDDVTLTAGTTLSITQTPPYPGYTTDVYTVIEEGFIRSTKGDFIGLNTTGADSYNFTTSALYLGGPYEGGYLICQASSVQWIVAPSSTEVSRSFHCRNDAVTTAESNAACGDWFIPSCSTLQNPGAVCRTFWDSYSAVCYWSGTQASPYFAWMVDMSDGSLFSGPHPNLGRIERIRAFRCVSY